MTSIPRPPLSSAPRSSYVRPAGLRRYVPAAVQPARAGTGGTRSARSNTSNRQPRAQMGRVGFTVPATAMRPYKGGMSVKAYKSITGKDASKEKAREFFNLFKKENQEDAIQIPNSLGAYVTINSMTRLDQSWSSGSNNLFYIYFFTPSNLSFIYIDNNGSVFPRYQSLTDSNIETCRASRFTFGIMNTTNSNSRDGTISVCSIPSSLDLEYHAWSPGDLYPRVTSNVLTELAQITDSASTVKNYTADDIKTMKTFAVPFASFSNASTWNEYIDYSTMDVGAGPLTGQALIESQRAFLRAQALQLRTNTLIVRVRASAVANSFSFFAQNQMACRFPANTLLSKLERVVTTNHSADSMTRLVADANMAGPEVGFMGPSSQG